MTNQFLKGATGGSGGGIVTQQQRTATGAFFTMATLMPDDDTIPQQTEGDEIITVTITPTATDSILLVEATVMGAIDQAERTLSMAIFRDATADAIAATVVAGSDDTSLSDYTSVGSIRTWVTSGSISATTFKIRCGDDSGAQSTVNGQDLSRRYGGVANTSITVTEYSS